MVVVTIHNDLADEAGKLDRSSLNRSNIEFSRLSMKIARQILSDTAAVTLPDLEKLYQELANKWNTSTGLSNKPPFCCLEGVAYAINALKVRLIQDEGYVRIVVPFYCEFERGGKATPDNPNGEESPIQKLEECLFLLEYNPTKIEIDLVFVNDTIAEKKDDDGGGSSKLFKQTILEYVKVNGLEVRTDGNEFDFDYLRFSDKHLCIQFTSCEEEAIRGSPYESPQDKRTRLENRDPSTGKLRERKGGAVLAGLEMSMTTNNDLILTYQPHRIIRCLVDGDIAHPVASFVGDAAYSILELGSTAYLGNMKHSSTCISVAPEESSGGYGESAGTRAKVKNRKLFFSGFIVPFLFPELSNKYKYTGTTQLPIKAFRGDIDFRKAKLPTVQPNVDLGMLALLCTYLNENGGSIDSGPVTIRDNVASSTMTTSDLGAEWNKTYGPIFTSAVGLCRDLKPYDFDQLPAWATNFIETMELNHYESLFNEDAMNNSDVTALFETMEKYKGTDNRDAVLAEIKAKLDILFPKLRHST